MPALLNLTGHRFGRLKVVSRTKKIPNEKPKWNCICDCGNTTIASRNDLRNGDKKSCGCLRKELLRIDLTGKEFGKLTVLEIAEKRGKSTAQFWKCRCNCGNKHIASSQHLRLGYVNSCGCCKSIDCEKYKETFFENVEKTEICWNWTGRKTKDYGILFIGFFIKAHRFSYILHKGPIPKNLIICHKCNNPGCVNPDHLYAGTYQDNVNDRINNQREKS